MLRIRPERPDDLSRVRLVNERAFGQPTEADLADALRVTVEPQTRRYLLCQSAQKMTSVLSKRTAPALRLAAPTPGQLWKIPTPIPSVSVKKA
jgi:hypothetical protein